MVHFIESWASSARLSAAAPERAAQLVGVDSLSLGKLAV
jgi:hypothetical protein